MGLSDDKINLIESADVAFANALKGVDEQLAKEILKIYAKFVVDGKLSLNIEQLAQLEDSLIAAIAKTNYKLALDAYIPNFEAVENMNSMIQQKANKLSKAELDAVINENENIVNYKTQVKAQLRGTPSVVLTLDGKKIPFRNPSLDRLIEPIAEIIRQDVITGISFESAADTMLNQIQKKKLGLDQWAGQISKDALMQSSGVTNEAIKTEFKMEYSLYRGTIMNTTRPICYHLLTQKADPVYTDDEISAVLSEYCPNGIPSTSTTSQTANGKPQQKGGGMIPGTSLENFTIRRGGFNCRHDFVPLVIPGDGEKVD